MPKPGGLIRGSRDGGDGLWGSEFFGENIFTLRTTHDELFVPGESWCASYIHRVYGVEEAGETFLGRVREVIVECHKQHWLSRTLSSSGEKHDS